MAQSTCTQPSAACPVTTPEKIGAGVLSPREASRLLMLFDRFHRDECKEQRAEWNLLKANIFEVNWLLAAKKGIKNALSLIDLDVTFVKTSSTSVLTLTAKDNPSTFLSVEDVAHLAELLEQQLGRKGLFDYNTVMNSTVGSLKHALAQVVASASDNEEAVKRRRTEQEGKNKLSWPKELTVDAIDKITSMATTPSGFDDTLEDEAGFGTASVFGAPHIFYPNANLFDSRHVGFAMAPVGGRHIRVYREYEYQCIYVPPHEIVHALQTLISDSQIDGWRHEWEASVACLGLLSLIARRHPFLFVDGLAEETMLAFYHAVVWGHSQVSDEVKAGYRQWRDSGGKHDPIGHGDSGHAVHHNPVGTWYCKARISIESFEHQQEEENCFQFLQEILLSIQEADARKAAPEPSKEAEVAERIPQVSYVDLEEVYLRSASDKAASIAWEAELLPIETVVEAV